MATQARAGRQAGRTLTDAIQVMNPPIVPRSTKRVLFNGNGYGGEWHAEPPSCGWPIKEHCGVLPWSPADTIELSHQVKVYKEKEMTAGSTAG